MRWVKYLFLAVFFILLPAPAKAWGPTAHLDFGLEVLKNLSLLAPTVAFLLRKFPEDFLYGSVAADITLGKNLSPYYLHCHNWQVGFSVLDLATKDKTRSFAWGYLAHLAADIVAHNYFVPYKIVQNFERRTTPHIYWEMRFETWLDREIWKHARELFSRSFKEHDQHLRRILINPLFSFSINKRIFNGMVFFHQILQWQRMVKAYARRSSLPLTDEEVKEMRLLCIAKVTDLLSQGTASTCLRADPTGHRNILIARDVHKRLRALHQEGLLLDPNAIGNRFRPLFREAMDSKLILPSILELTDPHAPTVIPKKNRRQKRKSAGKSDSKGRFRKLFRRKTESH